MGNLPLLRRINYRTSRHGSIINTLLGAGATVQGLTAAPPASLDTTYESQHIYQHGFFEKIANRFSKKSRLKAKARIQEKQELRTITNNWDPTKENGGSSTQAASLSSTIQNGPNPEEHNNLLFFNADLAGSTRIPADKQGIVGVKPTNINEDPSDVIGTSFYGPIALVAKGLEVLDPETEYSKYIEQYLPVLKIAVIKGTFSSNKSGNNAAAALANEIALERTVTRLRRMGHIVEGIDAPLNFSIWRRVQAKSLQSLGLSSKKYCPLLSKKQVKKIKLAYVRKVTLLGKGVLDECLEIVEEYLKDDNLDSETRKYLEGIQANGLRPEHLTDRVFIAGQLGEALEGYQDGIKTIFAECQEATDKWYQGQGIHCVLKIGNENPFAEPSSILSYSETKMYSMVLRLIAKTPNANKSESAFSKFVEQKQDQARNAAYRLAVRSLTSSFPVESWENALNLFSAQLPETLQVNPNQLWSPVSTSISGPGCYAPEMMGLVHNLEQKDWNTPILPTREIYTGPQPMPPGETAGHRAASLNT